MGTDGAGFRKDRHAVNNYDGRTLYRRILGEARPYWRVYLASVLANVVAAATEPALPALFKMIFDQGFVLREKSLLYFVPAAIIGLFLVRGLANFVGAYSTAWVGNRVVMNLREALYGRILSLPTLFFDNNTVGQMVADVAFNVDQMMRSATTALVSLVKDSLTVLGLTLYLLWLNWQLSLIVLAAAPPSILLIRRLSRRLRGISRNTQKNIGDMAQALNESLSAHKVVKIFGGEAYEHERFHRIADAARRFEMKRTAAVAGNSPLVELMGALALAIIVTLAVYQAIHGATTLGSFFAFVMAMMLIFAPVKRLIGLNDMLQRGLAASEVVFAMLDRAPEPDSGTIALPACRGDIRFESVSLAYEGKPGHALADIDLHIQPGETVALVGPSGAGKTSLVNLLPRFYHPSAGRILLDGVLLEDIRLADLRANIALVSQDVVLFNDSLRANIAYGAARAAGDAQIQAACEAAHAWEFIAKLPEGLDTPVGENGTKLSGGQRQRVAIARALLKNAPILILDEATSALDTASERHVQAALETLMRGRTTIVIAHRLSTIEKADRIVVLQAGRIVETGSHRELLARGAAYAHLHRLQFHEPAHA